MRKINSELSEKLSRTIQTRENDSNPSVTLWVTRSETPLLNEDFLDKQNILSNENISDVSISVCHPRENLGDSKIYIAYISDGIGKIISTESKSNISAHIWEHIDFNVTADSICIAFNGSMPKLVNGKVEFITEKIPWVFWTFEGALYGKKINSTDEPILLAENECTDVTAVRAMGDSVGNFDFGLVLFFIINGKIYYRQLINNEWYDAEIVSFGPKNVTWSKISSFRTWDYRIGLQAKTIDGDVYELFTQSMGLGKQSADHIDVVDVDIDAELKIPEYVNAKGDEHIDVNEISIKTPYGGLYSTNEPNIVSVYNKNNGNDNWGILVDVVFDTILSSNIDIDPKWFKLVDSTGVEFEAYLVSLNNIDENIITLTFNDFNSAIGECLLIYTPGNIESIAGIKLSRTVFNFTLTNISNDTPQVIEPVEITNLNEEGTDIYIKFSDYLDENIDGVENDITVTVNEYDYYPGGTLSEQTKTVTDVIQYSSLDENIDLTSGKNISNINVSDGVITLQEEEDE